MDGQTDYFNRYSEQLTGVLLQGCVREGYGTKKLLQVEELEDKWQSMAPSYLIEALANFRDYPSVSLAWAGYLGMGLTNMWDSDLDRLQAMDDCYSYFANQRGFDFMDEFVMEACFGLVKESEEYKKLVNLWQMLAESALSMMRKENVSPQSGDAYLLLAHTTRTFYIIGISVALSMMGYSNQKISIG